MCRITAIRHWFDVALGLHHVRDTLEFGVARSRPFVPSVAIIEQWYSQLRTT